MNAPADSFLDIRTSSATGWPASLNLAFEKRDDRTIPTRREHHGPLRILKGFSAPGGQPDLHEQLIVHPPGGIASGDSLDITVSVNNGGQVMITSPGAAKWYRSSLSETPATQQLNASVGTNACLEWMPLENIVFNGSVAQLQAKFELTESASLISADVFCLGRPAADELFESGQLTSKTTVARNGSLLFSEQAVFHGGDSLLTSATGLAGATAFGTLLAVPAADQGVNIEGLCDTVREHLDSRDLPGMIGVTALPELIVARWIGNTAFDGWAALREAWQVLRPVVAGLAPRPPRIWAC
jgi:urease accessory protein